MCAQVGGRGRGLERTARGRRRGPWAPRGGLGAGPSRGTWPAVRPPGRDVQELLLVSPSGHSLQYPEGSRPLQVGPQDAQSLGWSQMSDDNSQNEPHGLKAGREGPRREPRGRQGGHSLVPGSSRADLTRERRGPLSCCV